MPSADVLDFTKLLAPIPGDKPTGTDQRLDLSPTAPYRAVRDARFTAAGHESALRKAADAERDTLPRPDWRPVLAKGIATLVEKSKDLEVTTYMLEALVRLNGFAGLRDGFRLVRQLCEQYWDNLFPMPTEDEPEARTAYLANLNGEERDGLLIAPIAAIPITDSPAGPPLGQVSLVNYKEAESLEKLTDEKAKERRIAAGGVTKQAFEKAVQETPSTFYKNFMEDLTGALEEFAKLNAELTKRCGDRAPPSSQIRSAMVEVQDFVKNVAKAKLAEIAPVKEEPAKDGAPQAAAAAQKPAGQPMDVLRDRSDAFRIIGKVAEFFRRTEPHNPISYALEQAVRWAQMPLPDLVAELLDDNARKAFFQRVGIKPPEPPPKK
jgi:type VI secretion system protein ImpA